MSVTIIDRKLNKHASKMLVALRAIVKQHTEHAQKYNVDKIFYHDTQLHGLATFMNTSAGDLVFDVLAEIDNEEY